MTLGITIFNLVMQIPKRFDDIKYFEITYTNKHSYAAYGR
jgi:hypothetical protein